MSEQYTIEGVLHFRQGDNTPVVYTYPADNEQRVKCIVYGKKRDVEKILRKQ